jgi:molybdate transport system substrate-binding protein
MRLRTALLTLALTVAAAFVTGCRQPGRTVTVFAASSLKATFERLGTQFEGVHPGVTVRFSFAGSSDLAAQLLQGAPADVFASADQSNMDKVAAASLVTDPRPFATNTLTIATPPGNPASVARLGDLTRPGLRLVVCAPQVPCGTATRKLADAAGLTLKPVSEEQSVSDVLGKVISGEADAGVVYRTDAIAAGGKVTDVPFPESSAVVNRYPIAVLRAAPAAALATAFAARVAGPEGRRALAEAGFGAP